jgi:hypothetical protein
MESSATVRGFSQKIKVINEMGDEHEGRLLLWPVPWFCL